MDVNNAANADTSHAPKARKKKRSKSGVGMVSKFLL